MPITFDSLSEAREYQKRMVQTEQIGSRIRREGDKFVVTLIEKKPIKTYILPSKELEKIKGIGAGGTHIGAKEEHSILLPVDAGTSTRLHEIGHARLEHETVGNITLSDRIDRELDAEIFSYQTRNKELSPRVGWNAVRTAVTTSPRMSYRSIINAVSRKLEERGIPVTREDKQWFIDTVLAKTDDPELEEWKKEIKEEF